MNNTQNGNIAIHGSLAREAAEHEIAMRRAKKKAGAGSRWPAFPTTALWRLSNRDS